jgi:hypothetical protein
MNRTTYETQIRMRIEQLHKQAKKQSDKAYKSDNMTSFNIEIGKLFAFQDVLKYVLCSKANNQDCDCLECLKN